MLDPQPYSKTILSLANSRRPDGHCFAGKEFANGTAGGWIRPINTAHRNAVSDEEALSDKPERACEGCWS